jgi:hypothetical protein
MIYLTEIFNFKKNYETGIIIANLSAAIDFENVNNI